MLQCEKGKSHSAKEITNHYHCLKIFYAIGIEYFINVSNIKGPTHTVSISIGSQIFNQVYFFNVIGEVIPPAGV